VILSQLGQGQGKQNLPLRHGDTEKSKPLPRINTDDTDPESSR
jgi:hypothetical protein